MDTRVCIAEPFNFSPETIATQLFDYIPILNKEFKNKTTRKTIAI